MSGERKSIVINANSLLGGGGGSGGGGGGRRHTKRSSGERKIRPSSIVQPSTLKKTLLERIKQHQRTRERARDRHDHDESKPQPTPESHQHSEPNDDNTFSQSIDFLRKLAMKRRQQQQQTQKQRNNVSTGTGLPEAKTPESQMLNKVAETLHNGEILTNTGLLGLPVVQMPHHQTDPSHVVTPMISLGAMPMPQMMPTQMTPMMPTQMTQMPPQMPPQMPMPPAAPPNITELADMYNNTIASVTELAPAADTTAASASASSADLPLHIPNNPEEYLPSIFIKEEPPHGCLKNGKKPTFREWATKMLGFQSEEPAQTGGGGDDGGASASLNTGGAASLTTGGAEITGMRVKIRKTKKKSYRIGKHDDVVGVLLKNKKDQNHIRTQHLALKQKTIGEIRKYLYDHHLLKIGSNAPPDVLRRMYEDSILTGDVKNTNKDVLLHNFMSGGGGE